MKPINLLAMTIVFFFGVMFVLAFTAPPDAKKTMAFGAKNPEEAQAIINRWCNLGYSVKFVCSQSIATGTQYSVVRGDFLIIMEK